MTSEPQKHIGGRVDENGNSWTVNTLRVHILALIEENNRRYDHQVAALEKQLTQAIMAAEKMVQTNLDNAREAVAKAESAAERRFEQLNELRAMLSDQQKNFMSRVEAEIKIANITEQLKALSECSSERRGEKTESREGRVTTFQVVFALLAVVAIVISLLK